MIFKNSIVRGLFVCQCFSVPRDRNRKKDAHICGTAPAFHIVPGIHKTCPVASAGAKRKTVPSSEISEDSSNTSADRSITFQIKSSKRRPFFFLCKLQLIVFIHTKSDISCQTYHCYHVKHRCICINSNVFCTSA